MVNHLFEKALVNRDLLGLSQFSVGVAQHMLGVPPRLRPAQLNAANAKISPPELQTMDNLEMWYRKGAVDENEALAVVMAVEGKAWSKLPPGAIFDDNMMFKALQIHAGNETMAKRVWLNMGMAATTRQAFLLLRG
jgi:hypothetical protein